MVTGDAIIQAAATMVVGAAFLITLRQALGLPTKDHHLFWLSCPISLFAVSGAFAIYEEEPIAEGYPQGSVLLVAKGLFLLGMFFIAFILAFMQKEVSEIEKRKPKPASGMMFCRECGKQIPRDSKFCQACGARLCLGCCSHSEF